MAHLQKSVFETRYPPQEDTRPAAATRVQVQVWNPGFHLRT